MAILTKDSLIESQIPGQKLYPFGSDPDLSAVLAQNFLLSGQKIIFDLKVDKDFSADYDSFRIVNLSSKSIAKLKEENFPFNLGDETFDVLFNEKDNSRDYVLKDLNKIELDYGSDSTGRVLVVFVNEPKRLSEIFLLSFSLEDVQIATKKIVKQKIKVKKGNDFFFKELKKNTLVSNLLFSYSKDKDLSGLFCVDRKAVAEKYAAFPNLIKEADLKIFDEFLYKIKFKFRKYDNSKNGYSIANNRDINVDEILPVENLIVKNSNYMRFYNFKQKFHDSVSNYQGSIKLFVNDVSIRIAKNKLVNLQKNKKQIDPETLKTFIDEVYGKKIPRYLMRYRLNINNLSIEQLKKLVLLLEDEITLKIDIASEKRNANENAASQYFSPKFFIANFLSPTIENNFKGKISFKDYKDNSFISFDSGQFFKTKSALDFDLNSKNVKVIENKTFSKVEDIRPIKEFLLSYKKDEQIVNSGLKNKTECGTQELKADESVNLPMDKKELVLSITKNLKQDIYYLDSVNDTAAGLIFKKVDENTLPTLEIGQKLLLRINNYNEYYDSYFYLVNNLG